ncbi:MAG: hypothetical protein JNM57_07080 [Cyclobacteriaceae bacterium]|nr:hypothetical protein [Cyclobacteriaceae bacterium]
MKKQIQSFLKVTAVACVMAVVISACKDDDNPAPALTGESKTYALSSVSNPAINGTVKFAERADNATVITIDLMGTTSGNTHVAHIHQNTAAETGAIILDLTSINGATGKSETIVTKLNDGTGITYDQLLALNGYVNVHLSATDLTTLIAQGDIGENELTATSTTYSLVGVNESGIDGTVTFAKRTSGSTLVTVDLDGASAAGNYPIYIYDNNVATGGPIAINLNNYNGATGKSVTSVRKLNNNTAITYDQLRAFNGHINVGTSATDATYVAQGNIGSN